MKKRVITGIVLGVIFVPLLIIPKLFILFQILMMALAVIAAIEMIKMYDNEKKTPLPVKVIIILATLLVYLSALVEWCPSSIYAKGAKLINIKVEFLPMLILIILALFSCLVFVESFDGADVGKALTTIMYVGLGFASLTILRFIGLRFLIYLFIITVCTDVFAYIVGCSIGKHKMCPRISPKKSWEGAFGGTFVACVVGTCFAYFYGDIFGSIFGPEPDIYPTLLHGLINTDNLNTFGIIVILAVITLLASIFSQIGDLVASRLKRTYDIKDFGRIFPGHGGVLDRLDSALFTGIFLLSMFNILSNFLPI